MGGIDLTPTFKSVDNKFSVKYFVNLVLIDEQERKYFKQQEIHFFRSKLGTNDFKQSVPSGLLRRTAFLYLIL